jgi:hypothetical protein
VGVRKVPVTIAPFCVNSPTAIDDSPSSTNVVAQRPATLAIGAGGSLVKRYVSP